VRLLTASSGLALVALADNFVRGQQTAEDQVSERVRDFAPLAGPLAVGDISAVVVIVLLTQSLRRPATRPPRWRVAFVLLAAALPCIAVGRGATYPDYGPSSGNLTEIVVTATGELGSSRSRSLGWDAARIRRRASARSFRRWSPGYAIASGNTRPIGIAA
jgi:hypothetical protein